MKIFCGTDIVEIKRIKKAIIKHNDNFKNKIYTNKEIEYCEKSDELKYQHYAARFSAKEAVFKALSKILNNKYDIKWKNIEILNDENGRPYINFIDFKLDGLKDIDLSLSHSDEYAVANVIVMYNMEEK